MTESYITKILVTIANVLILQMNKDYLSLFLSLIFSQLYNYVICLLHLCSMSLNQSIWGLPPFPRTLQNLCAFHEYVVFFLSQFSFFPQAVADFVNSWSSCVEPVILTVNFPASLSSTSWNPTSYARLVLLFCRFLLYYQSRSVMYLIRIPASQHLGPKVFPSPSAQISWTLQISEDGGSCICLGIRISWVSERHFKRSHKGPIFRSCAF